MKMLISSGWLQNRIESDPDLDFEAGVSTEALESLAAFLPESVLAEEQERSENVRHAFGLFVRNLRLQRRLTTEKLSENAAIDVGDIVEIETNDEYQIRPRTVFQLARYFRVDEQRMMLLSGITKTHDYELEDEALKFAAKSNGVSALSKEEQRALNEFVKYLNEN